MGNCNYAGLRALLKDQKSSVFDRLVCFVWRRAQMPPVEDSGLSARGPSAGDACSGRLARASSCRHTAPAPAQSVWTVGLAGSWTAFTPPTLCRRRRGTCVWVWEAEGGGGAHHQNVHCELLQLLDGVLGALQQQSTGAPPAGR